MPHCHFSVLFPVIAMQIAPFGFVGVMHRFPLFVVTGVHFMVRVLGFGVAAAVALGFCLGLGLLLGLGLSLAATALLVVVVVIAELCRAASALSRTSLRVLSPSEAPSRARLTAGDRKAFCGALCACRGASP